jgi:ribosomal protein S27E
MMNLLFFACRACGHEDSVFLPKDQPQLSCSKCGTPFPGVRVETVHGFVYILSNESMPGLIKIGMTENDVFQRAAELSKSTGVPEPYTVEAYAACQDPRQSESALHALFEKKRKPSREFFEIQLGDALRALREVAGRSPDFLSERAKTHLTPAPSIPAANIERGRSRTKREWTGSFVKVRADCHRCVRSYWVDRRAGPLACKACGAPLSYP